MEITRKKFLKLGLMGGARPSTRNALRSRRESSRTAPRPRARGDATTQAGAHGTTFGPPQHSQHSPQRPYSPSHSMSRRAGQIGPDRDHHEDGRVHAPQHITSPERLSGSGVRSETPKKGFRRWLVT